MLEDGSIEAIDSKSCTLMPYSKLRAQIDLDLLPREARGLFHGRRIGLEVLESVLRALLLAISSRMHHTLPA